MFWVRMAMVTGKIAELWRYPVKSMGGERVAEGAVTEAGLAGDRAYALVDVESGKVCSAKHPRLWAPLLQCRARYSAAVVDGAPAPVVIRLPDGSETGSEDPEVDGRLSALLGRRVHLTTTAPEANAYLAVWPEGVMPGEFLARVAVEGDEEEGELTELTNAAAAPPGTFFDVASLHLLTVSSLRRLGELEPESRFEVARYRPNVVLAGEVAPFAENEWTGRTVHLGEVVRASVLMPTMRCIMTTLAQGSLPRDPATLRAVTRHNRTAIPNLGTWSCLGAYAGVTASGRVAVGDDWA